jgi:hypothetical protein
MEARGYTVRYRYDGLAKTWWIFLAQPKTRDEAEREFWHHFNNNREDFIPNRGRPTILSIKKGYNAK